MPAITASVTLRVSGELLERVDRLVATSRNAWLVWVVEQAVLQAEREERYSPSRAVERALGSDAGSTPAAPVDTSPTPAEQPQGHAQPADETFSHLAGVPTIRAAALAARPFRPYPKGGKR